MVIVDKEAGSVRLPESDFRNKEEVCACLSAIMYWLQTQNDNLSNTEKKFFTGMAVSLGWTLGVLEPQDQKAGS